MKSSPRISRRDFLKIVGAASAVSIPSLLGYQIWRSGEGENLTAVSPYPTKAIDSLGNQEGIPILVLISQGPGLEFNNFHPEILRTEGISSFRQKQLDDVTPADLSQPGLVILAHSTLTQAQQELLKQYVAQGGHLIAMRPDPGLAGLFGLELSSSQAQEGYLALDQGHQMAKGFTGEALQVHGESDQYRLAGADVIAWFSDNLGVPGNFPAVTSHSFGLGTAVLWAYDLAKSIVLTRQGNPDQVGVETDGRPGIRAHDSFVGWMDLDRIHIPQADEQMRLFSRLIQELLAHTVPLPRTWYFPAGAKTLLVATGDSHANPAVNVEEVLQKLENYNGRMSVYFTPPNVSDWRRIARKARWWASDLPILGERIANPFGFPSPSQIEDWRARGHEFTFHPYVENGVEQGIQRYAREFAALNYDPISSTVRTHRVLWDGWVETARVQASYNIRMNMDFYHIGPAFRKDNGDWAFGHFTGSGLPMKFIDESGQVINAYQQLTQLVDEHLFKVPWGGHVLLEPEEAIAVSTQLLDYSLQEGFSAIAAQFHVDPYVVGEDFTWRAEAWLDGTLAYAAENDIPIWPAQDWLAFTDWRQSLELNSVRWNPASSILEVDISSDAGQTAEASLMIPRQHQDSMLDRVFLDDVEVTAQLGQFKGLEYGFIPIHGSERKLRAHYL